MTFKRPYSAGLAALAVGLFAATAAYAGTATQAPR